MASSFEFNPNATESQYSLQMAGYLVHGYQPSSVLVCSDNPDVAIAAVQRLAWVGAGLRLEQPGLAEAVAEALGIRLHLADGTFEPDVALVLFSRKAYRQPPKARHLVWVGHNAISYKKMLYPRQAYDNVISQIRWFRRGYSLDKRVGMFGPGFLVRWAVSLAAGARFSPFHFRGEQLAMERLYSTSPVWWMGYLIALSGSRAA